MILFVVLKEKLGHVGCAKLRFVWEKKASSKSYVLRPININSCRTNVVFQNSSEKLHFELIGREKLNFRLFLLLEKQFFIM